MVRHRHGRTDQYSREELITPARAAALLDRNTNNRRIRSRHVAHFVGIIERGEWKVTHQGIGILKSGQLGDGQHRLLAILKTGVSCRMWVTYNLPEDACAAVDRGIPRTLADLTGWDAIDVAILTAISSAMARSNIKLTHDLLNEIGVYFGRSLILMANAKRHGQGVPASVRAAFVVRMTAEPHRRDEILRLFSDYHKFSQDMPPQLFALRKWTQRAKFERWESMARTYAALDKRRLAMPKLAPINVSAILDEMELVFAATCPELMRTLKGAGTAKSREHRTKVVATEETQAELQIAVA